MSADRVISCPECEVGTFREYASVGMEGRIFEVEYSGNCETCSAAFTYKVTLHGIFPVHDAYIRRNALEEAAEECEERSVLNSAVEPRGGFAMDPQTKVVSTVPGHRAIEASECAFAIRTLKEV